MIEKVNWVEIPVSDMDRAKTFYADVLGMKKEWEGPTWTGFNVGDVLFSIALSGTKGERAAAKVCRGCSPCALRLATGATRAAKNVPAVNGLLSFRVKNLDEVCKVLKTKGVEFLAEPHQQEWGGRTALILDPDKNVVVLCEAEKQGSA